jgi:general secretion pathway protein D
VPGGNADALAKNLQEIYKAVPGIRISAVGSGSIMVWAGPSDQFEILEHIRGAKEQNGAPEVIPLTVLDATEVVDTLKGMFGDGKGGGPFLKADTARNAVVVKGTPDQMSDIRVALTALGEGGTPTTGGTMRVITLDRGSAAAVAEELERMLPKLLQNPVQVITPGGNANKSSEPSKESKPKSSGKQEPDSSEEQEAPPIGTQFVDPQQQKPAAKDNQPAGKGPPVKITAIGNKLIISSDDPKALQTAQEMVRLLTQPQSGQGEYEAIRLKNASATDAAKALDEAFNGPKQQAGPQQGGPGGGFGGFFGRFGAAGATPPSTTNPNAIRVVAYPPTNTLLVRASPLDMLRIRQLLKNAIDTEDTESKGIMRTFVLKPLKYADATDVANVIKEVYREYTNNNPVPGQVGGFPGFGFGGRGRGAGAQNANVDASGNPRAVGLSVGVDAQANRLIVNCTESLYEDIQKLADNLDSSTKDSTRTIRVIPLVGVDPLLVQQAIDAIQGRRTTPTPQQGNAFGMPGGGGFGGRGSFGGGMNPGMLLTPRTPGGGTTTPGAGPPGAGGAGGGRSTTPRSPQSRGPDFFGHRVKDDPELSILYDPQQPTTDSAAPSAAIQLTKLEEQQPPATAPPMPDIRGPRAPVTAEALEQLGVIVISGNNPSDVDEIIRIIDYIRRLGAGAEVQIQLVPLEHADATSVASILTQLFQRVVVTAAGNVRSTQPTTTTAQTPFGASTTTQAQAASVVLLPLPRFNAILMAAPKIRVPDILDEIKRLDRASSSQGRATPFSLKKASASRVATLLINWYNQRYPNEPATQNQIRITYDDSTNTVFVQAAPADLEEIRQLIDRIDNTVSNAVNDLRIVPLRYALASDMATLMVQSISQGIVAPTTPAPTIAPTAGAPGAFAPGAARPTGTLPGAPTAAAVPTAQTTGTTKTISLRFFSPRPGAPGAEAGILEDIHITPDARTNSLILAAQSKTMELLLALIRDLDVPPPARAEVKVFPLRRSDASTMASILQQLLFGTGGPPTAAAAPAGAGGTTGAAAPLGATNVAGVPTTQYTISGAAPEGAPLVGVNITVDVRTNSLVVAAGRNEMDVIDAVIHRLEAGEPLRRENRIVHLRYASAPDVANALQSFLNNALTVIQRANQYTSFLEYERDVVVFAEPITNQLLVSASPQYFPEVMRLIDQLDIQPPEVIIQVLIAEVDLTSTDEFGVEFGLQSPVLFSRSVIPAPNFLGTGTVNYTNTGAVGNLVPPGVTVNSTLNPAALQGFNFNNASTFALPLGNNPVVSPGVVGYQGLSALGVGRADATGIGGFVFSAASNTFNLLIRALKKQGRIDVLSRPQLQTMDNQTALVNIGQDVPYVSSVAVTTGVVTPVVSYRSVGVIMQVTPRIGPDGTVIMRVIPEVSSVLPTQVSLGSNITASEFAVQHFETTVSAKDGETVAIGGLITKRDTKMENKYPWLGDLPYVGTLFRYRTQDKAKTELMVILTPHVVRSPQDKDRILAEEARRMDWVLGDVVKIQGNSGMAPILPPAKPPDQAGMNREEAPTFPLSGVPCPSDLLPGPAINETPAQESLPQPRNVPQAQPQVSPKPSPPAPMSQSRP